MCLSTYDITKLRGIMYSVLDFIFAFGLWVVMYVHLILEMLTVYMDLFSLYESSQVVHNYDIV